jgi:lipopolysaccharide transport system ATP-binding protein
VEFAELAAFMDTPVKHYSSGMNARLGFSIAAHLDPEVLVIDEVLAIGDDAFQRKAFSRLAETVRRDVPTIVVSHQLHRVAELCSKAILLTRGRVVAAGSPEDCINAYVGRSEEVPSDAPAPVRILTFDTAQPPVVEPGQRIAFRIRGLLTEGLDGTVVGLRVRSHPKEELMFIADSSGIPLPAHGAFELAIDVQMNLVPGTYRAQAVAWDGADRRELARGPSVLLSVGGAATVRGRVFSDPRVRLVDP